MSARNNEDGGYADEDAAPAYTIPSRRLGALEHPMIIKNLDKAIKTFGQNSALQAVSSPLMPVIEKNGPNML